MLYRANRARYETTLITSVRTVSKVLFAVFQVQALTVEPSFTAVTPVTTVEIQPEANEQYYYLHDPNQMQQPSASVPHTIEADKYSYSYDASYLTQSYPALEEDNVALHHQSFDVPVVSYETMVQYDTTGQHTEQPYLYV